MKFAGVNLIRELSLCFGPSGCEDAVRDFILEQIKGDCDSYRMDKAGNLIATVKGSGMDYDPANPKKLMLSAHMDEVGFMVREITEEGYLKFGVVGGIDPRVLCGRHVLVGDRQKLHGVIASKAIHLQTPEERTKATPVKSMYIDIGAKDGEDAKKHVSVGDYVTFDSDFVLFGTDQKKMKGKALDDRAGCALLIEIMRELHRNPRPMAFDVCFAFTTCEEIGISGANVAAFGIQPDCAIILESTAVNDLPGAGRNSVSYQGKGGALSLADRSTIYDTGFVDFALRTAEINGIPCQVKQLISGGNDAAHIQRSLAGIRVLALSMPTRYIHSASNVAQVEDYESMRALTLAMIRDWKLD